MEWYRIGEPEIIEIYEDEEYVKYLKNRHYNKLHQIRCTPFRKWIY
jgi:hypothetical protein